MSLRNIWHSFLHSLGEKFFFFFFVTIIHFGALHHVYLVKRLHRVQHGTVLLHVTILSLGCLEQGTFALVSTSPFVDAGFAIALPAAGSPAEQTSLHPILLPLFHFFLDPIPRSSNSVTQGIEPVTSSPARSV